MNLKSDLKKIVKIANNLDIMNLHESADQLTKVATKLASKFDDELAKYESRTERENEPKDLPEINTSEYSDLNKLEDDPLMIRYKELAKNNPNWYDEEMTDLVEQKLIEAISGTYLADELSPGDYYNVIEPWVNDEVNLQQAFENYEQSSLENNPDYYDEDDDDDGDVPPDFGM